jgi:hypothetical protein
VNTVANLLELDRALLIIAGIGFVSGVTQGTLDSLFEFLIKKKRGLNFSSIIARKYMYLGSAIVIIYSLLAFASISVSSVAIMRLLLIIATANIDGNRFRD